MESPYSWSEAEWIINRVLRESAEMRETFTCGFSTEHRIVIALRDAGLLVEKDPNEDLTS